MNQKVLESSKYPAIVFESTAASAEQLGEGRYQVSINGNLSLHGVTRQVPVTAQVTAHGRYAARFRRVLAFCKATTASRR